MVPPPATLTTTQTETALSTETTVSPITSTSTSFITVLTTGTICGPTGGTCNAAVDYLYPTINFAAIPTAVPVTHTVVSTLYATSCPWATEPLPPPPPRFDGIVGGAIAGAAAVMAISLVIQWRQELKERLEKRWKIIVRILRPPPVAAKNMNTNFGKVHGNINTGDDQENTGGTYNYGPEPAPDPESVVPASISIEIES